MRKLFLLLPGFLSASASWSVTSVVSGSYDASMLSFQHKLVLDLEKLQRGLSTGQTEAKPAATVVEGWTSLSGSWSTPTPDNKDAVTIVLCTREPVAMSDEKLESYGITRVGTSPQSGSDKPGVFCQREFVDGRYRHIVKTIPAKEHYFYRMNASEDSAGFNLPPISSLDASCTGIRYGDHFAFLEDLENTGETGSPGHSFTINAIHQFDNQADNSTTGSVPGMLTYGGGGFLCCGCGSRTTDDSGDDDGDGDGDGGAQGGGRELGNMGNDSGGDGGDEKRPFSDYEKKVPLDDPQLEQKEAWITAFRNLLELEQAEQARTRDKMIATLSTKPPGSKLASWAIAKISSIHDEEIMNLGSTNNSQWTTIFNLVFTMTGFDEEGGGLLIDELAVMAGGLQQSLLSEIKHTQDSAHNHKKQPQQE